MIGRLTVMSQTRRAWGLVWDATPAGAARLVVLTVLSASLGPVTTFVSKLVVDGVVAARSTHGIAAVHVLVETLEFLALDFCLFIAITAVERMLVYNRQVVGERLVLKIGTMILEKALTFPLSHFEDAEFYDKLARARRDALTRPLSIVEGKFQILRHTLAIAGYCVLLLGFSRWIVPTLLVAGFPLLIVGRRFSRAGFERRNRLVAQLRQSSYLEHVLVNDQHAKEVKLFGLGAHLLDRYRKIGETRISDERQFSRSRIWTEWLASLPTTGAFYAGYATVTIATARGDLALGDMTVYLMAFRQAHHSFHSILTALGSMYEDNLYLSNFLDFLSIPVEPFSVRHGATVPTKTSARKERGIRFEAVGFRYPGSEKWVVKEMNLFVPPGENLAIVGVNGAGKTTLVKLLTRLYDPTEGRILLDGTDLLAWNEGDLRQRLGVVFQDFNRYHFTLRENVGLGSIDHMENAGRVLAAVSKAGADSLVTSLGAGIETQLGRYFQGGIELSGGQWQKIALARAFMREEADILVLDEPSAALDAHAEDAVFRRFRTLAEGRTTILISHRFATVRMADRIVVIEDGRVFEQGTHTELLAAGGRYANLFTAQAQAYAG